MTSHETVFEERGPKGIALRLWNGIPPKNAVWCAMFGVLFNNYRYCIEVNELAY